MNNPYGADQDRLKEIAQVLLQAKGNVRSTESAMAALIPLVDVNCDAISDLNAVSSRCNLAAVSLQDLYDEIAREAFHERQEKI